MNNPKMNKNPESKTVKWTRAFQEGFSSASSGAEANAEIAQKIRAKGDKNLAKLEADMEFVAPSAPAPAPRRGRAPKAPAGGVEVPIGASTSKAPKAPAAPKAPKAASSTSKSSAKAFDQFYAYRRYKRYVKLCHKRNIELPSALGNLSPDTSANEIEKAINAIQDEFDTAGGEDSIKSDIGLAISLSESVLMDKRVYGRFHRFNLHGLSAAVEKNWDVFADEIEELILKYNWVFTRGPELRFGVKMFMLARTLHEYNMAGSVYREAYDAGSEELPAEFSI